MSQGNICIALIFKKKKIYALHMQCILDSYKYNITYLDGGIFLKMMG